MKKITLLTALSLLTFTLKAQFVILNPGRTITQINDLEYDGGSKMIFATNSGILIHDNSNWKSITTSNGLTSDKVMTLEPYSGGFMYSTDNTHVGACDYNNIIYDFDASNANHPYQYVSAIHLNNTDTLFGTNVGSVFRGRNGSNGFSGTPVSQSFSGTLGHIISINQLSGNVDYHVISSLDKIMIYQTSSGSTFQVGTPLLPSNKVLSNVTDGNTTYDGTDKGLYVYDFQNPSYQINKSNTSIASDVINAVAVFNGNIFLGTPMGLSVRVHNKWETFTTANSNIPSSDIAHLAVEKNTNTLWVATKQGDICKIGIEQLPTLIKNRHTTKTNVNVYPNPSDGNITIDADGNTELLSYSVYDVTGAKVTSGVLGRGKTKINLSTLAPGLYLINVNTSETTVLKYFSKL